MAASKCATCTTLRRKIRALQGEIKKLAKKAETPGEKQARIAKVRASFKRGQTRPQKKEQE